MRNNKKNGFARYIRRTLINKICALALILIGFVAMAISNDVTVLACTVIFALPLFFAKHNYIYL